VKVAIDVDYVIATAVFYIFDIFVSVILIKLLFHIIKLFKFLLYNSLNN